MKNLEMTKYIIKFGVFRWGVWMYLATVGFQIYKSYKFSGYWDKEITLASFLLMNIFIWAFAGIIMGFVFWRVKGRNGAK